MQKIFLITCLMFCTSIASAQAYQSIFGKHNTSWNVAWDNLDMGSYSIYSTGSDTIFNGKTYKVVYVDNRQEKALLREDTLSGEVWFVKLDNECIIDTTDKLVFDIGLQVGDSFNISSSDIYIYNPADTFIIVDSVYYVQGQKRIRFFPPTSSIPAQLTEPITFIEGVGPNYSLFWLKRSCVDNRLNKYLLCAFKDSFKDDYNNLRYNGECNPIFASINEISESKIKISPNPANNYIDIGGLSNLNTECVICNGIGQLIDHYTLNDTNNKISLNNFAAGYYLITFYEKDVKIGTDRFVKTN